MMPHVAMTVAATLWASSFIAGKALLEMIPPPELALLRFTVGAAVVAAAVLCLGRSFEVRAVGLRAFVTGFFEPGLITIVVYWGVLHTSAVHGVVIFALMPLVTSLLGRAFLGEPITRPVLLGAAIAIAGTVLLVSGASGGNEATLFGDAIVLVGMLLACIAMLVLRRVAQSHRLPMAVTCFQLAGAGVSGLVVAVGVAFLAGEGDALATIAQVDASGWLLVLYLGVLVSAVAFFIYNYALRHIGVGRISLYLVLIAPLGVPLAAIFLGETIGGRDAAAIALVVLGVAFPSVASQRRVRELWPALHRPRA